ncbi:hypothetical protein GBW32_00295 [Streptomyces tsukubensis]|uniref:Uncharacterized protein n=1 Tax=Streptomyces tsukubensis TaxID=83656 RepID=A0A1V4A3E3_9ACTN|nr:hypothetical protein B1H18_26725 [Streptomyces tsukubensis]QFR91772.1 hypothetical protein GBW32_00295 [Streptomyces tsukubensis]
MDLVGPAPAPEPIADPDAMAEQYAHVFLAQDPHARLGLVSAPCGACWSRPTPHPLPNCQPYVTPWGCAHPERSRWAGARSADPYGLRRAANPPRRPRIVRVTGAPVPVHHSRRHSAAPRTRRVVYGPSTRHERRP